MGCALQSRKPGADSRVRKLGLDLSIIVPPWNEEWCIYHTLTALMGHFRGASYEVLVVNDGSRDGTAAEVRRWSRGNPDVVGRCLCLGAQRGKGGAVKAGALASRGNWVAYIGADLDISADNLLRLYERAQEGEQDPAIIHLRSSIHFMVLNGT
ncbi:MAG: glycosyltransferase [Thermaerobacter sp.]|nr:glycosyltransferase [Thermaerobacter sp.]